MGPHAVLTDRTVTVRENIMTGLHFLGCKPESRRGCHGGTYDRHNQLTQVALAYLLYELKFTGPTSSVDSNYVGHSADGKSKHTLADGQVWGAREPLLAETVTTGH